MDQKLEIFWEGKIAGSKPGNLRKVDHDNSSEDMKSAGKMINFIFISGPYMKQLKDSNQRIWALKGKPHWLSGKEKGRAGERKKTIARTLCLRTHGRERGGIRTSYKILTEILHWTENPL